VQETRLSKDKVLHNEGRIIIILCRRYGPHFNRAHAQFGSDYRENLHLKTYYTIQLDN
jgi:hypothetical protein